MLVPIVTIQLVVSFAFIQRLYEDVTEQMTENIVSEVNLLLGSVNGAPDDATANERLNDAASALKMRAVLGGTRIASDRRRLFDLSGRVIQDTLRSNLDSLVGVDLVDNRRAVRLSLETDRGMLEVGFPRRRVAAKNPHQLLVLMVGTGILLTFISFLFLRNQLRPIRRLAAAADSFGKGESVTYHISGASEVRSAGTAFLNMRARIERQIEQRTLMLSGVSHDLRTPLTRLKLGLSMQPETPEVEALMGDVDEMERLIASFLEFAKADAMEELVQIDLVALISDIVGNAQRAGSDVTLGDMPKGKLRLKLRKLSMRRAVENLINNAVRYGDKARISVDKLETAIRISVEDDGPGIPLKQRDQATKAFSRLDIARNQNVGSGVGLGLAIAADAARSHGGVLRLGDSDNLGGLSAEIVLPR